MIKQRTLAIAGITGALLVGAGAGVVLNLPGGASAATDDSTDTTIAASDDSTEATTEATADEAAAAERPERTTIEDLLAAQVAAGTITQEQADAIVAAIEAARPARGEDGIGRPGGGMGDHGRGPGGFGGRIGLGLESAASALGITVDELRAELDADTTIADVAAEKGVDVQTVIDAIVAAQTEQLTERVTNMVNGVRPNKPADAPAAEDDSTSTTTAD